MYQYVFMFVIFYTESNIPKISVPSNRTKIQLYEKIFQDRTEKKTNVCFLDTYSFRSKYLFSNKSFNVKERAIHTFFNKRTLHFLFIALRRISCDRNVQLHKRFY